MKITEQIIPSTHADRPFLIDFTFEENEIKKPVVLFLHGFKGFKDWGHFPLISSYFAKHGCFAIKMNFSHNGTSPDAPYDFVDLHAFGENNFSIEMDDVADVLDYLHTSRNAYQKEMDLNNVYVMGHSRGGAIALLSAAQSNWIKGAITMAAVSDLEKWMLKFDSEKWMTEGSIIIRNGRTNQDMPMHFQMVENYYDNENRLNTRKVLPYTNKPIIAFHGTNDEALDLSMLDELKDMNTKIDTHIIKGANHTFGGKHPYDSTSLPSFTSEVVEKTVAFIKKHMDN